MFVNHIRLILNCNRLNAKQFTKMLHAIFTEYSKIPILHNLHFRFYWHSSRKVCTNQLTYSINDEVCIRMHYRRCVSYVLLLVVCPSVSMTAVYLLNRSKEFKLHILDRNGNLKEAGFRLLRDLMYEICGMMHRAQVSHCSDQGQSQTMF